MRTRFFVYAVLATLVIGGVAVVADALVESDDEQLEQLASELLDGRAPTDVVLRWSDLSREPIRVTEDGRVAIYDAPNDHALAQRVARVLAPLGAEHLEVVQRSVSVDGERGTVAMRVRADGELVDVSFGLARSGQGWLVTDVRSL